MPQPQPAITSRLFSVSATFGDDPVCSLIPGIDGDLQVVHSRTGHTLIDVQSVHFDVAGQVQNDHAAMRLTYGAVCELRALLDVIAGPMEPHQPALWSDATFSRPVMQRSRGKRRATA
jgi:hypothetical protein